MRRSGIYDIHPLTAYALAINALISEWRRRVLLCMRLTYKNLAQSASDLWRLSSGHKHGLGRGGSNLSCVSHCLCSGLYNADYGSVKQLHSAELESRRRVFVLLAIFGESHWRNQRHHMIR